MGNRRMFSLSIVNSARFLRMPISCQALYFHMGMRADDDGIVEGYTVMKMVGATEDDLKILVAKNFVTLLNEDLVSYINDWSEQNTIRADRKVDSIYKNLLLQLVPDAKIVEPKTSYYRKTREICQTNSGQIADNCQPNDRISKGKLSKDKIIKDKVIDYQQIADMYNDTCVSFPRLQSLSDSRKKSIKARFSTYNLEDFKKLFKKAESSSFLKGANDRNWSATFDWLIKDSNMAKVLDGNYDNQSNSYTPAKSAVKDYDYIPPDLL